MRFAGPVSRYLLAFGLLLWLATAPAVARSLGTDITVAAPGAVLAGTAIDTPAGPVLLFINGSGPTDRDGNSRYVQTDLTKRLAEALAVRGYASLRYDKRFSGKTKLESRDETQITLDRYARDAALWLEEAHHRYAGRPVYVAGHSQGGVVALRLTQIERSDGLIVLAVPGRSLDAVVLEQLAAKKVPSATLDTAKTIIADLKSGRSVGDVPSSLKALFRPGVYPFWRSMLNFDAPTALAAFRGPAFLVYGGRDLQVPATELDLFRAVRPDIHEKVFPDMNHVLRAAPEERAANLALYQKPKAPLQLGLVETIAGFLAQTATAR